MHAALKSSDALVQATLPELAEVVLFLGWVRPQRPLDTSVSLLDVLGDALEALGVIRETNPKKRFDLIYNNDFTWAYEPVIEGALHLQSRSACLLSVGTDVMKIHRLGVTCWLLRRGRHAIQSGDFSALR
ncbi:MAG: hypothetical protein H6725_05530 [Sandaracinaceae bacterium]|nr:hypothetical protein [Sandaracinaceae bacterium]